MTTKTEATGTTNPTARAMLRYVLGPLEGQSISGTVKGQMRGAESNAGANASLALAIKIIQPGGADRAVLLAQTAGDSASAGVELATSLTNAKFLDASESATISLATQTVTRGDYLVIEIGFRSATGTTRNIDLRYGDTGGTDLAEDTSTTADNVPWIEFTDDIVFIDRVPGVGAATITGQAPSRLMNHIAAVGVCALSLAGTSMGVAFPGAETGSLAFTGQAPTVAVGAASAITVPVGALTLSGAAPSLRYDLVSAQPAGSLSFAGLAPTASVTSASNSIAVPAGALAFSGTNVAVAFTGVDTGALAFTGQTPTLSVAGGNSSIAVPVGALALSGTSMGIAFPGAETGALAFTGRAPTLDVAQSYTIAVPVGALTLSGTYVEIAFIDPVPGVLTLQGLAPSAKVAMVSAQPVGALVLAGLTPSIQQTVLAAMPVGTLSLAGFTPSINGALVVSPLAGSLTLSPLAPARISALVAAMPYGTLTLAGQAPGSNLTLSIDQIPTGTLALAGLAPRMVNTGVPRDADVTRVTCHNDTLTSVRVSYVVPEPTPVFTAPEPNPGRVRVSRESS